MRATTRVPYPERAWAPDWEQAAGLDDCLHQWEPLLIETRPGHWDDSCERCRRCGAPRCSRKGCIERRHHCTVHIFEEGTFEPVGGSLSEEGQQHD